MKRSAHDRFIEKVEKDVTGPLESKCWRWIASFRRDGYGQFNYHGTHVPIAPSGAHQASWLLFRGPLVDGLWVLHRCDNKWCVNPDHLFLGTPKDNSRDMADKGRQWLQQHPEAMCGEKHPRAKFSDEEALAIRRRVAAGERQSDIAREYGVNKQVIWMIKEGRTYVACGT